MVGQNLRYKVGTIIYKGGEGSSPTEEENTSTEEEGTATNEGASTNNTGAIIGGAVGGIIGVLIVLTGAILLILALFKRRTTAKATLLANQYTHQELVETKGGDLQLYIYKFSH